MATSEEAHVLGGSLADVEGLEQMAAEYAQRALEYETKAAAIKQIIEGIRTLNGDAENVLLRRTFEAHRTAFETRPPDPNGPRGREAVLTVMRERPDHVWKVVDVKRELLKRGWAPSPKAVEASIANLRASGELQSAGYGHYRLPAQSPDAPGNLEIEEAT